MPRPPLVLLDVLAPVPVPGFAPLQPGETVSLALGTTERIVVARALPHYVAGALLMPFEDGALQLRDESLSARARAELRGWRVG